MPGMKLIQGVCILASLSACGCAHIDFCGSDDDDHHHRQRAPSRSVPLSDVMKQSQAAPAKPPVDEPVQLAALGTLAGLNLDQDEAVDSQAAYGEADWSEDRSTRGRDYNIHLVFDASHARSFSGELESVTRFALGIGGESDRNFGALYVAGGPAYFKCDSVAREATKLAHVLDLGLTYRRYFSDPHVFVSPYLALGGSFEALRWRYENAVVVDGEAFAGDTVLGAVGQAGVGLAFNRSERVTFFTEGFVGGTYYANRTIEGFANDLFDSHGFWGLRAGMHIKW
jgi:hypothetical protein